VSEPNGSAAAPIDLAEFWHERGVPVPRPARPESLPIGPFVVSAWERILPNSTPVDWRAVGAAIRTVHDTDPQTIPQGVPLPKPTAFPWWDFERLLAATSDLVDAP